MIDLSKNSSKLFIIAVIFILAYIPTLQWMWDRWWAADSYYSHGVLVPFVSAYLIWQQKEELAKIKIKESQWGLAIIIFGVVLHLFSAIFRIYFSSGFAMLFVFIGIALYFYGVDICKRVAFPIFFLVFMLPLPEVAIINLSFKLKMFAAELATMFLNSIGIEAIRDGSWIKMPHAFVIVDDVCSGLRSLISLTALGSIFAYWLNGPLWKRGIVFLMTIPIAIFTNMIRVIFLAFVSEIWGVEYIEGFLHDASGFAVFALAFLMLYVVNKVIE